MTNVQNDKERVYKPKILRSSEIVSPSVAKEKAKKFAEMQEEIGELGKSLPDELHLETVYSKKREDHRTFSIIDERIFYHERVDAILRVYENKRAEFYNKFIVDTNNKFMVNTNCEIFTDVFSDYHLEEPFKKFVKAHPKEPWYPETTYFFDAQGRSEKIIRLPAELCTQGTVIFDHGAEKECLSDVTLEDVILVERALSIIKQRCEDYLTWSNIRIFS